MTNPFEQSYRDTIQENLNNLRTFPSSLMESLKQSTASSHSENRVSRMDLESHLEDCLNAMNSLARISRDLELLNL